jgi:type IV secretion system protein VirB9
MDTSMIRTLRNALLASCVALPALAQEVPPINPNAHDAATVHALAQADAAAGHGAAQASATAASTRLATTTAPASGTVPMTMPPKIDPISPDKSLSRKAYAGVIAARRWINKYQKPKLGSDGTVHFLPNRGQPFVVTAVDHITDIALAPGEIIVPPLHIGAAEDWKFHPAVSGSGRNIVSHILVKPDDAGLSTNLVIETNKRTISIALVSRRSDYMPLVAMDLPDDDDSGWNSAVHLADAGGMPGAVASPCDQPPAIGPEMFKITGDRVDWRPLQVWAVSTPVGYKTCIEFPAGIGSGSLPALLALADDGGWFSSPSKDIVNVRFVNRRYIADELLNKFVLISGVGSDQKSVRVVRKETR